LAGHSQFPSIEKARFGGSATEKTIFSVFFRSYFILKMRGVQLQFSTKNRYIIVPYNSKSANNGTYRGLDIAVLPPWRTKSTPQVSHLTITQNVSAYWKKYLLSIIISGRAVMQMTQSKNLWE
jgi:hypothetical protein